MVMLMKLDLKNLYLIGTSTLKKYLSHLKSQNPRILYCHFCLYTEFLLYFHLYVQL